MIFCDSISFHFNFSTGPKVVKFELTSITIHFFYPFADLKPLPTDCPQKTLDNVGLK